MKKSDLKTGMRVVSRCGGRYLVIKDVDSKFYNHQDIAFVNNNGFMIGDDYGDDLLFKRTGNPKYDIMEVGFASPLDDGLSSVMLDLNHLHSIWKRIEPKNMTKAEIEKELGYPIEIVEVK